MKLKACFVLFCITCFLPTVYAKGIFSELIGGAISKITSNSISSPSTAQKYAISQFDNGNGRKVLVIQGFKSADCKKLIDTFAAGLKIDCPQCTRDYGGCSEKIDEYQSVWLNNPYAIPYLSSGNMRIINLGISRNEANTMCKTLEKNFKNAGKEAFCVF